MSAIGWIPAEWPAPPNVRGGTTTRVGGVSLPPYDTLNLGDHVGDDPAAVRRNRERLRRALRLPGEPRWLNQVHGTAVAAGESVARPAEADGCYTAVAGVVCAVLTADCLPLLLCDRAGRQVAAAHAGWRGLLNGVIEQTLARFTPVPLLAWLGPAIGPESFEVGGEVREQFCDRDAGAATAFRPHNGRWLADIYRLARRRLAAAGVEAVYGGGLCTRSDPRFFSYRREATTGRMATLIWFEPEADIAARGRD